jgi:hypothetical protein
LASSTFSRLSNTILSEQEEVIQSLKVKNDTSDGRIWFCLGIVMGFLAVLSVPNLLVSTPVIHSTCKFRYASYLSRRVNPLSPFFSTNAEPPRIPLDIPFALLHAIILIGLPVLCQVDDNTLGVRNPTPNYALFYAIAYVVTAMAPAYCLLTGQGLANIAWWSLALVAVAIHHFVLSLILQGKKNISRLEGLKYNARGV